jgi:nitroreductase
MYNPQVDQEVPLTLALTPDELLSTTHAVRRRLDFDRPLDLDLVRECLQLAIQAPSGSNRQGWHFVLVTDPQKKQKLADIYRKGWDIYSRSFRDRIPPEDKPLSEQTPAERVSGSAAYLAKNFQRTPVILVPCIAGRVGSAAMDPSANQASHYGSILPATWSFMLAARARGLGTCWTTLHLLFEEEAAAVLGIPYDSITQVAMIPVAHALGGTFHPAPRKPLDDILHMNGW